MSAIDARQVLMLVFTQLRRNGFMLGVGELLAALQVLESGMSGTSMPDIKQAASMLWCHSQTEEREFAAAWSAAISGTAASDPLISNSEQDTTSQSYEPSLDQDSKTSSSQPQFDLQSDEEEAELDWSPRLLRSSDIPALREDSSDLAMYWPVSRRFMVYSWRYLRDPLPDGPADILDVAATVDQAVHQGAFFKPVYRRRIRNHAHLLLLIDQDGSMVPFHRFTRDIVDTARYESTLGQVSVFYFHNISATKIYTDAHLTEPCALEDALSECSSDTSVLVISDAGAARGHLRSPRLLTTTELLSRLRRHTQRLAWLNPMPEERWAGTSAQIIAHLVPMFQMDPNGLSKAIDVVRGQPSGHSS
jgi:uncharacterized protein